MATNVPTTLGDYFDVIRRRWVYVATILPAAILIAVYLAFTLPAVYRATATVLLEPSSIPQDLIKTTVTTYADQQLELISRQLLAPQNLKKLVEEIDPYPDQPELDAVSKARLIADNTETQRVDPITFEPLPESNAFSINYENPDPDIAVAVTTRLGDMFLSFNRETRAQQAEETHAFLQQQSQEASARIAELEKKLATFKTKYGAALPETQVRNQEAVERISRDLDTLQQQILLATERKRMLEVQLIQINPNLFDPAGDWRTELTDLQTQLAVAQQKYTPDHPDVRRLRRAIQALATRVDEARPATPPVPDNPEYIQLAGQLDTVKRELAVLESNAARDRKQIEDYERSFGMAPEVEREYSQLQRDYAVANERFRGIETSLAEAALGRSIESEARGNRLTLIRAPYRPNSPASPNRLGIMLLGLVLGGALAVGLAAVVESSDPTIRSARDLGEITDIKVIASIPVMLNGEDRRKRLIGWATACVVAAVAVLIVASAVKQAMA